MLVKGLPALDHYWKDVMNSPGFHLTWEAQGADVSRKQYLRTVVIAPMTGSSKNYPTRVEIKHDNKIGWIVLDQLRTIDKQRIVKILGNLPRPEIKEVKAVLKEIFID